MKGITTCDICHFEICSNYRRYIHILEFDPLYEITFIRRESAKHLLDFIKMFMIFKN